MEYHMEYDKQRVWTESIGVTKKGKMQMFNVEITHNLKLRTCLNKLLTTLRDLRKPVAGLWEYHWQQTGSQPCNVEITGIKSNASSNCYSSERGRVSTSVCTMAFKLVLKLAFKLVYGFDDHHRNFHLEFEMKFPILFCRCTWNHFKLCYKKMTSKTDKFLDTFSVICFYYIGCHLRITTPVDWEIG